MTCRVHLMSGQREVLPDWAEAEGWPGFVKNPPRLGLSR